MAQLKCGFNDTPDGVKGCDLLTVYGPTLVVDIGFDSSYDPKKGGVPVPGVKGINALVDTGATESCIDNLLAAELKLPIVDRRQIAGVGGTHMANVYLAQVHVVASQDTIIGAFAGVDLRAGGQVHSALIGRTFLRHFIMTYNGKTGDVAISS
jgi:predicted aspartyl protease